MSPHHDYFPNRYLAIDQGPIVAMIENYRTGLGWKLFMGAPEVKEGLKSWDSRRQIFDWVNLTKEIL